MLPNTVTSALIISMGHRRRRPCTGFQDLQRRRRLGAWRTRPFLWLAKTKARANWRRKVRVTPTLGTDFSNWGNAETSEERCITAEGGTVCIFTGYPCKR